MKKCFIFLLFLGLILLPLVSGGCTKKEENKTSYYLDLSYDEQNYVLNGNEKVEYFNNSENMFTCLYFHLYPNAFREDALNSIVSQANHDKAYPNGESYGNIEIKNVECNNNKADYLITGEDENILQINLPLELFPDESCEITIEFAVKLAFINHRLGIGENTINFGNFYPIACVYEDGKGFKQDLYHSNGDPFYSECAFYDVKIEFLSDYEIASSGKEISFSQNNDKKVYRFQEENIRDFCFVLSKTFDVVSCCEGETEVRYYGYKNDDNLQSCLAISVNALKYFSEKFCKYPYKTLSVVKSNFVHGGMEYPNLVLISDDVQGQEDINYVIIHEIAHQWWYGIVGNDQYNHAWMDEGLAEYSTIMFYKDNPKYNKTYEKMIESATASYKVFVRAYTNATGKADGRMDRPLCEFKTEPEYVQCTYTKGVLLFNSVAEGMGQTKFLKALRQYAKEFKYKNAAPEDMISVFNKVCGCECDGIFKSYLEDKVVIL